ncbi:MAG: hypothetical protein SNJ75_15405 [Gemmataceae bacterium]
MRSFILVGCLLLAGPDLTAELLAGKPLPSNSLQAEGFGATVEEARNNAWRNLLDQFQPLFPGQLDPALLERYGRLERSEPEPMPGLLDQPLVRIRLTFTPTREWLELQQRLQQEQRAKERQWWLGRILAALVLVFAVLAGYLQLEEWTRGYATRWLRAIAIGLLLLGGLLLWWVR